MKAFLDNKGNPMKLQMDEDVVSLVAFIAQLPPETPFNMDVISKIIASSIEFYVKSQSSNFCEIYRSLLESNDFHGYIMMREYRINVKKRSLFQVILLTSLKFNRKLFEINENREFLYFIIELILKSVTTPNPENLHILKLLENIYRKREDILNNEISLMTLKTMNKVACLPIFGFKRCATDISKIALKNLSENYNYLKYQICYYPVNCVNANDVLNLIKKSDFEFHFKKITDNIIKSFFYNVESREGSFYYETLINLYDFDEFKSILWPIYRPYFTQFDEGEFCNSLLKYWIPITIKYYGNDFYNFVRNEEISIILKAYILLEVKQKNCYNNRFDTDIFNFLQYPKTNIIGLNIVSNYLKKNQPPNGFEINLILLFLKNYSNGPLSGEVVKIFKRIFSQIFLVSHISLLKSIKINLELYQNFLYKIFSFCFNRIDTENCQIVSQLITILFDVSFGPSEQLILNYKLDQENFYDVRSNLFYRYLENINFWNDTFFSRTFIEKIELFLEKFQSYSKFDFIELILRYYLPKLEINSPDIRSELDKSSRFVSLQNLENNKVYFEFLVKYLNFHNYNFISDLNYLKRIYFENLTILESQSLFLSVVVLNILIEIKKYHNFEIVELLEKSLEVFCDLIQSDFVEFTDVKTIKALEALINTVVDCLYISKNGENFENSQLLENLTIIIKKSNMKKPVTKTINLVQYFGDIMEQNEENRKIKMKLLEKTLNSINTYPKRHKSKIRRNPEARLVIHALTSTGNRKIYTSWSLKHLLAPYERVTASVSALHSLEILISDASCHQLTLPFLPEIMNHCIQAFLSTNWMIRNANLQLVKALIERLLGVSMDYQNRPKCIEDIFIIFPNIVRLFFEILTKSKLDDRAIIVLLLFSESQLKNNILREHYLIQLLNHFRDLFLYITANYSNHYGLLAIKTFTSLCLDCEIPEIIEYLCKYIKLNFCSLKTVILSNFIKLIQELYSKKSSYETTLIIQDLINFLKKHNNFYFNLLSIRLYNIDDIGKQIIDHDSDALESRIWLNNHIPYLVKNQTNLTRVADILKIILFIDIPVDLETKILSIMVDKSMKTPYLTTEILQILILRLKDLSNSDCYLSACYSKSILLFYELDSSLDLSTIVNHVRCDFSTKNIYKMFIYVLILSHQPEKSLGDLEFLDRAVQHHIDNIKNDDILNDLASNIVYLYKANPVHNRYNIFKLIFYLFFQKDSSFEICKFISYLTGKKCTNHYSSLCNFLDFNNLNNCLNDASLTKQLLLEFYQYTTNLSEVYQQSSTFYLIENDLSLTKKCVRHVIRKNLLKI